VRCELISTSRDGRLSQHPVDQYNVGRPTGADRRTTSTPPATLVWTCREGARATARTCHRAASCHRATALLEAIVVELRAVTSRLRADDERSELAGDWKHAAMVVDRFCLWTFTAFTVVLTLSVLLSAPHLIVL